MSHPLTTVLATLLFSAQQEACVKCSPFEYRIYEVINSLADIQGYSDPAKADLYAMLAEWVVMGDSLTQIEGKVAAAMTRNRERYPHG